MAPCSSLHYRQCFRWDVPPPPSPPNMDAVLLITAVNSSTQRYCKVSWVRNVLNSPYVKRNNDRPQAVLQHNTNRYQGSVETYSLVYKYRVDVTKAQQNSNTFTQFKIFTGYEPFRGAQKRKIDVVHHFTKCEQNQEKYRWAPRQRYGPNPKEIFVLHTLALCIKYIQQFRKCTHSVCTMWVLLFLLYMPYCWLEDSIRKVLRPATSTQVFLGFLVSIRKCWDGSQDSKLPLHASHVALPT